MAQRLAPRCVLVNVHCRSSSRRVIASNATCRDDALCGEARLRKLLPLAERLQSDLYEPLALDCPLIVVDTDDGYAPPLQNVIDQIDEIYSRPLIHDLDRPARRALSGRRHPCGPDGYPLAKRSCPA